jgi:hypothetical protein
MSEDQQENGQVGEISEEEAEQADEVTEGGPEQEDEFTEQDALAATREVTEQDQDET